MTDADELLTILAVTRFAGRPHALLERSGGVAVAVQIDPSEARDAWTEARALLGATGRWPVAITTWPQQAPADWQASVQQLLDPKGFVGKDRPSVETILRGAVGLDLKAVFAGLEDETWAEMLAEEADGDVAAAAHEMQYWFEPSEDQPTAMMFLPTPAPWASVAFESWYAEDDPQTGAAQLVALLKRWHDAYGAELVAHWGTMLQFHVERPPRDIEQARALAREQLLVAPCTALLPGTHPEMHAAALMRSNSWFLHERP